MSAPTRTRWQRHRLTVLGASVALVGGGVVAANLAGAASGPSAVDYAQCSNGAPSDPVPTDCPGGWINGILNANNSQYHEDQVTPQRLLVAVTDTSTTTTSHSVTLKYLDRKSGIHAYDYLAAADATQTDALAHRCDQLSSTVCASSPTYSDTAPVAADPTVVNPFVSPYTGDVNSHMVGLTANQKLLHIYGATFATPAMSQPTHDNAAASTGDDYATTTISFVTHGAGLHYVQLLFGGHLAAGSQTDGWGDGLGASSVSGGPYHIKWAAADGLSVGNRDNQIMSNAILAIVPLGGTLATTPDPTTATVGDASLNPVSDTATFTPDSGHPPTGTVTFDLYGPLTGPGYTDCSATNLLGEQTGAALADNGLGLGGYDASTGTPTSGSFDLSGADPGVYGWVAHYVHGTDPYNTDVDGTCGDELVTINQATPTGTSTQTITDTVTLSGGLSPSGSVSFFAYATLADCTADAGNSTGTGDVFSSTDRSLTAGVATSEGFTPTATDGTDFWWRVYYNGDTDNAAGDVEACGTQTFSIANG